jgi:broad specificity phosphatase PhoE
MNCEVILIRHAEVEAKWKTICYGALDVPLSDQGISASHVYAARLEANNAVATHVFHSGLARTETLARLIAIRHSNGLMDADDRLRERNYGQWQGLTWNEAYESDPEHFQDLIDQPDTYRPRGGETTSEMQRRIVHWYDEITSQSTNCRVIAITHSGPIAALAGHLLGLPANQWQPWTIKPLESIQIEPKNGIRSVMVRKLECY